MRTALRQMAAALPLLPLLLLATVAPVADALVYRDQVGVTDFHYELVGRPQAETTFFLRPRVDDRASLLYTLSEAGVLSAVNPSSGALVWRQVLESDEDEQNDVYGSLRAVDGEGWLAAGRGPSVHAWSAVSGRAQWWQDFAGVVADVEAVGTGAPGATDVLALSREPAATVLRRLDGRDGHVIWEQRNDNGNNNDAAANGFTPLHVRAGAGGKAYVVGLTAAHGLKVSAFDVQSGKRTDEHSVASAAADVLFVGGGSEASAPIAVWTDSARTKITVSVLSTKQKHEFALPEGTAEVLVHALRQGSTATTSKAPPLHFVVHTRTAGGASQSQSHRAQVFHVDAKTQAVQKAYDLPQAPGPGAFAVSANAAGDALFVTRITADEMVLVDSASHGILGRWNIAGKAQAAAAATGAAVAEVVAKSGSSDGGYAVRAAAVTEDEDWVLVRNGQVAWSRPEGLAGAVAAAFADRPESERLVKALEQEAHSSLLSAYVHRVRRHVDDLQHLPAWLQTLPQRLLGSVLGDKPAQGDESGSGSKPDSFGFHKVVILATRAGRLYGLDAASPGTVRWNVKAVDVAPGAAWAVERIHVDEALGVATVFAHTAGQTVAVEIETGALVAVSATTAPTLAADTDIDIDIDSTALVTSEAGPWVLVVRKDGSVGDISADRCPRETVVVRTATGGLQGLRFVVVGEAGEAASSARCLAEATWTFEAPTGFRVVDVAARPAHDPVASIGRVLGDRRVLYKYLNTHMVVVAAVDDAAAVLTTFLVDTVSGQVLASATYGGVDGRKPVSCLLFENTFVCTFFADVIESSSSSSSSSSGHAVKGYQLVVSDLYESHEPNERAGGSANVSALGPVDGGVDGLDEVVLPAVTAQTSIVAAPLAALAVTQTRQGITTRQVLAYLPRTHGIVGLPRVGSVLDARRPVGRDPTPAELEEGLGRYAPNLEIDARHVVTHERDVAGIQHIVTAPTHVESTSLVLAFGRVDVFGTRVAPSFAFDLLDQGFGKLSMLGTVAALAVGVAVLRPMVTKKQINLRWQAPL